MGTLPPVTDCTSGCECVDPVVSDKCYTVREALPVCSELASASSLQSSDCTRLDKVYDQLLLATVVPIVGGTTTVKVCNADLYTVGNWIQFIDGSGIGAIFQVVSINTTENILTVRNACADGTSEIVSNPSPGATIETDSRFVVVGEPVCTNSDVTDSEVSGALSRLEEICLDNIRSRAGSTEAAKMLGTLAESDCSDGGEPRPCLRKLNTQELKDGTLRLANVNKEALDDLRLAYINANNDIVEADISDSNYVATVCGGKVKIISGGRIFIPIQQSMLSIFRDDTNFTEWSNEVDFSTVIAANSISVCDKIYAQLTTSIYASVDDTAKGLSGTTVLEVDNRIVNSIYGGESDSSNRDAGTAACMIELPLLRTLSFILKSRSTPVNSIFEANLDVFLEGFWI